MSGTVAPHTLPLATTSAFTPAGTRSPTANDGWQRALERACAGSVGESAVRAAAAPHAPAARPDVRASAAQPVLAARSVAGVAPAVDRPLALSLVDAKVWSESGSAPADPLLQPLCETGDEPATRAPASRSATKTPRASEPRLHVHVEQHAEGLAVFLGMPGDAATVAAHAAALLLELRRQTQGAQQRLAMVVCNGTPILPTPPSSKEKP